MTAFLDYGPDAVILKGLTGDNWRLAAVDLHILGPGIEITWQGDPGVRIYEPTLAKAAAVSIDGER